MYIRVGVLTVKQEILGGKNLYNGKILINIIINNNDYGKREKRDEWGTGYMWTYTRNNPFLIIDYTSIIYLLFQNDLLFVFLPTPFPFVNKDIQ